MNRALRLSAALLFALLLQLAGCTANAMFRTSYVPFDPAHPNPKAVIESTPDYKLGFVEFDDQGWFWDPQQRLAVEQMIRNQAGIGSDPGAVKQGIVLIAFVHGWKENAAYDGAGTQACRSILLQLSKAEKAQTDHPARKVVGVYVGWRGLSSTWEPFEELSFWSRKDTAHRVGGYGALTELFTDLENIQKTSLDSLPTGAPRTELIIIGHSFGGAAVYTALSQIITQRCANTRDTGKRLKPLGDQVILLNPAFEAQRHYNLNNLALSIQSYPADQRPVLSIFTSKGDWATQYFFPIGQFVGTLFQANRSNQQRDAGLQTIGWYQPFGTHDLIYHVNSAASTQPGTANTAEIPDRRRLLRSFENVKNQKTKWRPGPHSAQTFYFEQTNLEPRKTFQTGDPFLVVSVDPRIMKDHDDINNPTLIKFLGEYIQFCQVDVKDRLK